MDHAVCSCDIWGAVEAVTYDIVGFIDKPPLLLWSGVGKQLLWFEFGKQTRAVEEANEDPNRDDLVCAKILGGPLSTGQTQAPKSILKCHPHDRIACIRKARPQSINASFYSVQDRELARERARNQECLEAQERRKGAPANCVLSDLQHHHHQLCGTSLIDDNITRCALVLLESGDQNTRQQSLALRRKSVEWDQLLGEVAKFHHFHTPRLGSLTVFNV